MTATARFVACERVGYETFASQQYVMQQAAPFRRSWRCDPASRSGACAAHFMHQRPRMLHEFLAANDKELALRCHAKVVDRMAPKLVTQQDHGIAEFIRHLIGTLRSEQSKPSQEEQALPAQIGEAAGRHGLALLRAGYNVGELVHDYGDLCQALTELAHEKQAPITVEEFHTFNRCLDNAIADAVTEFGRVRDHKVAEVGTATLNERLGFLAHELRNQLNTATLAFSAIQTGAVAMSGATAGLVNVSLTAARDLIDRALADVRLTAGLPSLHEPVSVNEVIEQIELAVKLEAAARKLTFSTTIEPELVVHADRQMLASAVSNLLQNALKFTRARGHITLRAHHDGTRVIIEVADECGGLPAGLPELLFQPFKQAGADRSGLGLGLSISRRGVEASGGKLSVRDHPGTGCVFAIDLPRPVGVGVMDELAGQASHHKRIDYVARDSILKLLSVAELAQVCSAEDVRGLAASYEYLDLENLQQGVMNAPAQANAVARMLPRSAVTEDTWHKILAVLGVMGG